MKNITAIVISFLRPAYTIACIRSLREMYPEIKIMVGENGKYSEDLAQVCLENQAVYIKLPYDSGVCVARNTLIREVTTEYVLVGDDDFLYDSDAKVPEMLKFLENHSEFDLIGGRVRTDGQVQNYQGLIEKRENHFQTYAIDPDKAEFKTDEASGLRYCQADLTFNYFVGRTEKIRAVPWDERIKVVYEHFSWFYDFKCAGGRVAFSPDPVVIHKPSHIAKEVYSTEWHHAYMGFRNRQGDRERFFRKYKIDYFIGMTGNRAYAPDTKVEKRRGCVKHVDFCITTFKRPKALERLLFSIAEQYPMANIYVADQNEKLDREFYKKLRSDLYDAGLVKRLSVESLPYDCGLAYARNHLVTTTPNKYKLILDDDMVFSKDTDICKFVSILELEPRAGIVGGLLKQGGVDVHFEFTPARIGDMLYHQREVPKWRNQNGINYRQTGCVLNFALMRKDIFHHIQWDPELKIAEHFDFYIRFQQMPFTVIYTPDVSIDHPPVERSPDYKALRQRDEFQVKMLRKHGATKLKYLNGQVVEALPDGSLKKYKELPQ